MKKKHLLNFDTEQKQKKKQVYHKKRLVSHDCYPLNYSSKKQQLYQQSTR